MAPIIIGIDGNYCSGKSLLTKILKNILKESVDVVILEDIDYINAHGTSTPAGDVTEVQAVRQVFSERKFPLISSTKSLTGHSLGAAGVQEAIYSILMISTTIKMTWP